MDTLALLRDWQAFIGAMRAPATVRHYGYWVTRLLVFLGWPELGDITENDLFSFLATIGPRAPSKAIARQALRSLFSFSHDRGAIPQNPAMRIPPPRVKRPEAVSLSEEELTRLLIAAWWRNPRRAWTLMFVYGIGGRRGEAAKARPEDLESDGINLVFTKGGKPRWVPLTGPAKAAIEGLKPWTNGTILGDIQPSTVNLWMQQAGRDAGLPRSKTKAHILRKSFAKHLSNRGVAIEVISALLGHSSIAVTTVYLSVEREEKLRAGELL